MQMIRSFASRETEKLFNRQFSRRLPHNIQRKARIKLEILEAAESLEDLGLPPSNRLEKLIGDREGQYSIRINNQWRICFHFHEGDAFNVEIVDYH
jgi:proteic killer suppression protein